MIPSPREGPPIQLTAILCFYGLLFAVGLLAARRSPPDEGVRGLLLAGRGIPLAVGVFTMTATWVGGGYINGTAEAVYAEGLLWAQAPWGYALSLVLGGLAFARVMRRRGFTTLLDPFARRYGPRVTALLGVPALIGEVFWSAAILTALGTTFAQVVGTDVPTAILVSAGVAIAYTLLGGLRAVAYTDVVQLAFVALGLAVAVPYAVSAAGGLTGLFEGYAAQLGDAALPVPSLALFSPSRGGDGWLWLDLGLLLVCGGVPWQVYFQRVLACRDERSAVTLSLTAAAGCLLLAIPAALIGAAGAVVDWSAFGGAPLDAAHVLPRVLADWLPPAVGTIGLAAVAAAVMSSVDSSILSASSLLTWNGVRPLRPNAGEAALRLALRLSVTAVGVVATVLALRVKSVYALWYLSADLVYVVLFPQLVLALWYRGANAAGALAGVAVGVMLRLGGGEPLLGLTPFLDYPMQGEDGASRFPFRTTAMLASAATIVLVSWITARWWPPRPLDPDASPAR